MYESAMAHLAHKFGANHIFNPDLHSSSVTKVYQSLARKYGWKYRPVANVGGTQYPTFDDWMESPNTDFDGKYKGIPQSRAILYKAESKPHAASVVVENSKGEILWGKRRSDGKWTLPGGHLEDNEKPEDGAKREVFEETGLDVTYIDFIGVRGGNISVYVYRAHAEGQPHGGFDPDHEVEEWRWVDCFHGVPPQILNNLAHPENIALGLYGLQ